jgi:excisionase family DNA binding protein
MRGSKKIEVDGRVSVRPPSSAQIKNHRAPMRISKQLEKLLTITEAAEILRCSKRTVRRRIETKDLRAITDGGIVRIDPMDLQDYIRDHRSR